MNTLFDSASRTAFVDRIETLHSESQGQWGKMNVEEMLEHCNRGMEMMLGRMQLKRAMIGRLIGWLGKRMFIDSERPFSKNAPTDPKLITTVQAVDDGRVAEQKARLIASVLEFHGRGPEGMPTDPHPFFGKLKPAEWDKLAAKHLDHHLRQFNA